MIKTITINSKTIGNTNLTKLLEVSGFTAPKVRNALYYLAGKDGARVPNSYWGERNISLDLLIRTVSLTTLRTERDAVIKAFGLPRIGQSTMKFETTDGLELQMDVQLQNIDETFKPLEHASNLRIELVAPDPYLVGQTETETTLYLATGTGTAIPTVIPLSLAYTSGGRETVNVSGNGIYKPLVTITGPVENPIIKNFTTNEQLQIEGSFSGSDILVIDMDVETVVLNGNYNYLDYAIGTFWGLHPGANEIGLSSATYDANANAVVAWRNSYLGV